MNFKQLNELIANKMLMQHVYQPVMIKTLLESGNTASVRHIAQSLLHLMKIENCKAAARIGYVILIYFKKLDNVF
jgi:hypothetical protein